MRNTAMADVAAAVEARWGGEMSERAAADAATRLRELCRENARACRAKRVHYANNLFPCISWYEALQKNGVSQRDALAFMDELWIERAARSAEATGKMLGYSGLYKLYPLIFRWVAKRQFGTKAGFEADFYRTGMTRCKFDMRKCLFLDTCEKYGCPELTQCFCHTDDAGNEGLHPNLCWNRTQYMGGGAAFCDFDIYVKKRDASARPPAEGPDCAHCI